ncbi:MAG: YDG domain-containing protein [Ginsengibacter sp.]
MRKFYTTTKDENPKLYTSFCGFTDRFLQINKRIKNLFSLKPFLVILFSILMTGVYGQSLTVAPATGGTLISADKAANAISGGSTTLGKIILQESNQDDIGTNVTFVMLHAPAGWKFSSPITVTTTGGDITAVGTIGYFPDHITIPLTVTSTSNPDEITISGLKVQALLGGDLPNSGNITLSTDGTINGVNTSTNLGSLSQVAGNVSKLGFTTQPGNTTYGTVIPSSIIKTQDQFGNASTTGLGANLTVTASISSGTLTGTTTQNIGTSAGNGTVTFSDLSGQAGTGLNLTAAASGLSSATSSAINIAKKELTVTATGVNKTYDGNTNATVTLSNSGIVSGDVVTTAYSTATFDNKNVGIGKTVSVSGITINGGADGGNYTVNATASTTANITGKVLTVTATGVNKTYDGNTNATVTLSNSGIVSGDVVTTAYSTATFDNKNVGIGKTVSVSGITNSGADGGNYTVNATTSTTANITGKVLTVTATGVNKTYDGNATATVTLSNSGIVSGDVVTTTYTAAAFDNKNVGTAKTVSVSGIAASGADAGNYTFNVTASTTANITGKVLTVSAAGVNKIYDGTTSATVTLSDNRTTGDALSIIYSTATFANKNVGTAKTVSVSGISISGTDAGNYTFNTTATTTANITKRTLNVTASGIDKIFDNLTTATVNFTDDRVASDVLTFSYTANFNTKNVGSGKPVSVTSISISAGTDAGNYQLSGTTSSTTASITGRVLNITISSTGVNKIYDGTSTATVNLADNRVSGNIITINYTATFNNKNVGTNKPVTITGFSLSGTDAGNYTLGTTPASTTANISQRALNIIGAGVNKVYDGTTTAAVNFTDNRISGDVITINYTANFTSATVDNGKIINISGYSLGGTDGGNYTIGTKPLTTTANITTAPTSVTVTLTSGTNPSCTITALKFTATITSAPTGATGSVQFKDGGTNLGTAVTVSGNSATSASITALTGGSHNITAVYSATGNYSGSTSPILIQIINAAPTTNAGSDISSCSGMAAITMNGATATGTYGSVVWSGGTGLGTFSGSGNDPSTYIFTPSVPIGSFIATLTVTASTPCSGSVTSTRKISWGTTGSWLGVTSTNWSTASNWCGGVPTTTTDVTIPVAGSVLFQPVLTATSNCRNIIINGTLGGANQNLNVSGNWMNNGTFTAGTGTITFNGTLAQSLSGVGNTFYNFTTSNSSATGITLNNNVTVNKTLTFSSSGTGIITTGSNTLTIASGGSVSGADVNEYVYGNLQKIINGNNTQTFEIGDASVYAPVSIKFTGNSSTTSAITASTTSGDHPQIGTSFIDPTKNVNRYWTLTNTGTFGGSYAATFTYVTGDYTGANYNNFTIENYTAGAWKLLLTGTKTSTSTQATGITTFGDFQVGEEVAPTACDANGNSSIGTNITPCIQSFPNPEQTVTTSMSAHQYFTMDVIQGMTYQVYTTGAPSDVAPNNPSNRLTMSVFDNASPNSQEAFSYSNTGNPKGGNSNNVFIQFTATFSGRVRVLLNQRYNCSATSPFNISVFTKVNGGSNTFDNQALEGSNVWIGHIYEGMGTGSYTGTFSPYLGYYTLTDDQFEDGFGGSTNCYNVFSNGVVRANVYTEHFSVRYRLHETNRRGLWTADMGSDDGSRLAVDGQLVYNNWSDQGWTNKARNLINLTGNSSLLLDFYEKGGGNEISFNNLQLILGNTLSNNLSQSLCAGSPAGLPVSGDIYGTLPSGISLSGTGYQWAYSSTPGGSLTDIPGATGATYTPTATGDFITTGNYYIYRKAVLTSVNNVGFTSYTATNISSNYITLTVTTNSLPTPIVSGGNTTVCINFSTIPYTANAAGGTWSVINGTGSISIDGGTAVVTGLTDGDAKVGYTIFGTGSNTGCQVTGTKDITILPSPAVYTISGGGTYCADAKDLFITLSNSQTGVSYQLLRDGNPVGSPVAGIDNTSLPMPIGTITANTFTYTVLATRTVSGCTSVMSGSAIFNINPLPVGNLTVDNAATCEGENITFTATTGFDKYIFLNGASLLAQGTGNTYSSSTLPDDASVTVLVTNEFTCTASFDTLAITIHPKPTGLFKASETSGKTNDDTICAGSNVNFSFDTPGYATYEFKNVTTNTDISTGPNPFCSTTTLANNDEVILIVTTSDGCTQTFGPIKFTVNPYPVLPGTITGNATVCQGQNPVTYSILSVANATSYQWTVPSGANIISGQGTLSIIVNYTTTATTGDVTVIGINDCGNGPVQTSTITVNPLPVAAENITGTTTECQGANTITYSVPEISNATSYLWNYSGTGATISNTSVSGGIASVTIDFATTASTGNLTVKGHNDCGDGTVSADFPITMSLLPSVAGAITGKSSVCIGSTNVSYSVTPIDEATSYTWTYSGTGATINGTTNPVTIDFAANATSGILTVTGTNACGNGIASTQSITINPLPTGTLGVAETSGTGNDDGTICAGSSITFTANLTNGAGTNYEFFVGADSKQNGASATYNTTGITANATVSVIATNINTCSTTLTPVNVTVNPLPDVTINGSNTICSGTSGNLYNTETGQTNYLWTISGGNIDVNSGDNISVTWFPTGTKSLNVNYTDVNGCSSDKSATFIIPPTFTPTISGGSLTPCLNTTETYTTDAGNNDYTWVIVGGTATPLNTNTISVLWDQSSGPHSVSVNYTNATTLCSAASPTIKSVTVNALPSASISGTKSVCQGGTSPNIIFTGSAGKMDYIFTYNINGAASKTATTSGSNFITVPQATGTPDVYVYNLVSVSDANGCSQASTGTATITVSAPSSATISYTGGTAFCKTTDPVTVNLTGTGGGTYSATPAGLTIDATTGTITPSSSLAKAYTVSYSIAPAGGCGSFTTTTSVTITNPPTVSISYSSSNFCQSVTTAQPATRTGNGVYTGGTYSSDALLTINSSTGAITPNTSTAGTYTVTYSTPASGGCGVVTATFEVTITAVPDVTISYANTSLCTSLTSSPVNYTGGVGAYTGGSFASSPGGLVIDAFGTINPSTSTPNTYNVNYLIPATGGCGSVLKNTSITITPKPTVNAGSDFLVCSSTGTVNIPVATASNYNTVTWTSSGDGSFTNANSLSTATYTPGTLDKSNGSATLILTATGNGSCSSTFSSKLLTVSPNPIPVVIKPEAATYCVGVIVPLSSVQAGLSGDSLTFSANNVNINIPDNNFSGITSTITIPAGTIPANAIINNINVKLNITHPNDRDITVNLKAPNAPIPFINELNLINSLLGANFTNTIINNTSFQPIQNFGTAPFTGTFAPNAVAGALGTAFATSFSQLYTTGGTVNGAWTLKVADNGVGQTGRLNSWSISIKYSIPVNAIPVQWLPATDLYTDAAATAPYDTSMRVATVYAKPATQGVRIYNAVAGNGAGCITTTSVTLTGKPAPSVFIKADYCSDPAKRVTLKAITPDPVSFNWSTGVTIDSTFVDEAQNYSVSVTNSDGCVGTNSINIAQELVVNGDFEAGNTGFLTDYHFVLDDPNPAVENELYPEGYYAVDTNAHNYHNLFWGKDHTNSTHVGKFMIVNGYPSSSTAVIWQETVAVQPNTDYYYSAWAMNLNGASPAQLRFEINGKQIGTTADLNLADKPSSQAQVNRNNWMRFYYGGYGAWHSDTNTTAVIRIVDLNPLLGGNDFGIDDISFATLSPFVTGPDNIGTDNQTVCSEMNLLPITYKVGSGASGPGVSGLPSDLADSVKFDGLNLTISGSSIYPGTYNYIVYTTGTCANPKADSGTIVINPSAVLNLTSAPATKTQVACINTDITAITYSLSGGATGANVIWTPHAPGGIGGFYNSGVFTISGRPTEAGTFKYTVATTGSCLQKSDSGTVVISPASVGGSVNSPTVCLADNVTMSVTGNLGDITGWEFSTDGGTSWNPLAATNGMGTITYNNIAGPSSFRALSKNGVCPTSAASTGGKVQVNNLWEGKISSIWSNFANWSSGNNPVINDCSNTVTIPKGVPNNPLLNTSSTQVNNIHILPNGHVTVTDPGILQVAGAITTEPTGILDATNGGIEYNGSAPQSIASGTFLNNAIGDFMISNTNTTSGVTMSGPVDVYRSLTFSSGGKILNTNDQLTIKSTATQTAWVGNMIGHTINGKATVERYIGTTKRWQLVAVPTNTTQTIHQAWQENQAPGSGTNGLGTNITGPTGTGLDFSSPGYSMKYWDPGINDFTGISNTGIQFPNKERGYFIFVRGDRRATASGASPKQPTVLRTWGSLYSGNVTVSVPANTYYSIGNPYASRVEFDKITGISTVGNTFYVWDPLLTGSEGVGGYQTLNKDNGYLATAPGTSYYVAGTAYPYIESGQAFYVNNTSNSSQTLTFTENTKNTGSSLVFRGGEGGDEKQFFRSYLYLATGKIADGNAVIFGSNYSNKVDKNDAVKFLNGGENLSLSRNGELLAIETRRPVTANDTLYFNIKNFTKQTYHLSFEPENMASDNLSAYLVDNYLKTSTDVSLSGKTSVELTVNSDAASASANRLMIVFKQMAALPVTFASIKASQKDKDILVEWKVENEKGMLQYEVEKSIDGINFHKVTTVPSANAGSVSYQWIDKNANIGYNYYRIRSVDKDGKIEYSTVVKILINDGISSIMVYPNPITDGIIHLRLKNQPGGMYMVRLLNPLGQLIAAKQSGHAGGNGSIDLKWDYNLAHGIYQLEITKPSGEVEIIKVMY